MTTLAKGLRCRKCGRVEVPPPSQVYVLQPSYIWFPCPDCDNPIWEPVEQYEDLGGKTSPRTNEGERG